MLTILWTNPLPNYSFEGQTIPLDLSSYKAILVTAVDYPTRPNQTSIVCLINQGTYVIMCPYVSSNKLENISCRLITATSTGVQFSDAYNESSIFNGNSVPINIYGIK